MSYYDIDYIVKVINNTELPQDDRIVDVLLKRTDHYCKETDSYWENNQDEAVYLKVETPDGIDKIVCASKNIVKESSIDFSTQVEKENFYQTKHSDDFYNHIEMYLSLSDKQAIEFLDIMRKNIDDYDYNFQYCNGDKVIKNIVKPNLDNGQVENAYSSYLESSFNKKNIDAMLEENKTKDNVIKFPTGK